MYTVGGPFPHMVSGGVWYLYFNKLFIRENLKYVKVGRLCTYLSSSINSYPPSDPVCIGGERRRWWCGPCDSWKAKQVSLMVGVGL